MGTMKILILLLLSALLPVTEITAQHLKQRRDLTEHERTEHHRFDDVEKWARVFEDTARDEWQMPNEVIETIGIAKGTVIADIGSATGYFPVRFARVATEGRVYGIDIESNLVDYLNARAAREKLPNLKSILGDPDDPKIPERVDLVFICDTYHHIHKRGKYFENLKKYMQPEGRLVIVDFRKGDLPVGPKDEMKLAEEEVVRELTAVGYRSQPNSAQLPYQYVLVFDLNVNQPE